MANLDATVKLKALAIAQGSMAMAEGREGSNATAKLLFANEGSAFQNVQALKTSLKQPTEAILQKDVAITLRNTKSSTHSGNIGDSFVSPISYVQKSADFNVSYKLAENNNFSYQEQLNQGLASAMKKLRAEINAYGIANLSAQKTQVTKGTGLLTWDAVNFKYTNATGDANTAKQANRIKSVARLNNYGNNVDVIGGQQLVSDMMHYSAQGTANQTNYGWQFKDISLAEDELIDEATLGAKGFGFVLPRGMVGMTSWNEPLNRQGGRGTQASSNEGLFTTIADNVIPGLTYDVHITSGLADTSANGFTYEQDPVDKIEITAIYSFSHAMISVANETPIFAFEQL